MQSQQHEYDASDWLDTEDADQDDVKESRKGSKKNWKEQRRESRNFKRGEWE